MFNKIEIKLKCAMNSLDVAIDCIDDFLVYILMLTYVPLKLIIYP